MSSLVRRPRTVAPAVVTIVVRPVDRQHRARRIEKRSLQRRWRTRGADVAQVGRGARPGAAHPMAGGAAGLFGGEHGLRPRSMLPTLTAVPPGSKPARMKAMSPRGLGGREGETRHRRRDAPGDDLGQVVIGHHAAESAEAQVHAAHRVAVGAMTEGALGAVDLHAHLDVGGAVLVILREAGRCAREDGQEQRAEAPDRNQHGGTCTQSPAPGATGLWVSTYDSSGTCMIGQTLSHYRILSPLGRGAMGEVYAAEDVRLGRRVAVKLLPAELGNDPAAAERFQREARIISSLNHPNICTLYDIGEHQGRHFMVMELLEGEPLATRLARGPLPIDQVLTSAATSPVRSTPRIARASSTATSSRPTCSSPRRGASRCSTSAWPSCDWRPSAWPT